MTDYIIMALLFAAAAQGALFLSERYLQKKRQPAHAEPSDEPELEPGTASAPADISEAPAPAVPEKPAPAAQAGTPRRAVLLYALLGGAVGVGITYTIGLSGSLFPVLAAFVCLAAAARIDGRLRIIPNQIPLIMLGCSVIYLAILFVAVRQAAIGFLVSCAVGGGFSFGLTLILAFAAHGGFGVGDAKLIGALGALCGGVCVMGTLFFGTLLAALCAVFLLLTKRANMKYAMPFGPFVFAGYLITIVLGLC